jgi:hypothetical protein
MRIVLPDDASGAAIILASLDSAGRDALPTESAELLAFVRAHLMAPLKKEIGPKLAVALLNDLTAEMTEMGEGSSRGPNIKTPQVGASPSEKRIGLERHGEGVVPEAPAVGRQPGSDREHEDSSSGRLSEESPRRVPRRTSPPRPPRPFGIAWCERPSPAPWSTHGLT